MARIATAGLVKANVMDCGQARQLFDAYLDGELSASIATELDAHRIKCAECRRALALLEVSEHVLASTRDPVSVRRDFTDRLVACIEARPSPWSMRVRRGFYVGAPLAAAAMIALAVLGVFDRGRTGEVAGVKVDVGDVDLLLAAPGEDAAPRGLDGNSGAAGPEWVRRLSDGWTAQRRAVTSLQQVLDDVVNGPLRTLDVVVDGPSDDAESGGLRDEEIGPDDVEPVNEPGPDEEDL